LLIHFIQIKLNEKEQSVMNESEQQYSNHFVLFSMKAGRVVILLAGRHAGKKAIIVKQYDDGKKVGIPVHCSIDY
jgi:hypothetical protein